MPDPSPFLLTWLALPAGVALDLLLGDPQGWPHPVRWMGRAIEKMEPVCRRRIPNDRVAGAALAIGLIAAAWLAALSVLHVLSGIHPVLGWAGEVAMIYYALSIRSLGDAAMEMYRVLRDGSIPAARRKLAFIVSRDVEHYQAPDIARATVETVAENFVDGILSPLLFIAIGGAPLGMAFKMISTLDSMVGYKNDRYIHFGKIAARIDDAANYIPARLSVLVIGAAAGILSKNAGRRALQTALREGHRHSSPNAGRPEAAFAGALAVWLNGPNDYHGRRVEKPVIGAGFGPVRPGHIVAACRLMTFSAFLSTALAWGLHIVLSLI